MRISNLDRAEAALDAAGWSYQRDDDGITVAVTDEGGDDPGADASLAELRALVAPCVAEWTGDGNTDADGYTTSDVRITD